MTPKEKAEELVNKFRKEFDWVESQYAIDLYRDTRQCALIAVDEILDAIRVELYVDSTSSEVLSFVVRRIKYYEEVKQEIEKL
jgi:hypothetical protein